MRYVILDATHRGMPKTDATGFALQRADNYLINWLCFKSKQYVSNFELCNAISQSSTHEFRENDLAGIKAGFYCRMQ